MEEAQEAAPARPRHVILATLLGVIAIVLVGGGGWLVAIGGSAYYLVAGLLVAGTAVLLVRRDQRAAMIYAAMLAATLLWGVWESGWNLWGLQARLFAPTVLGIWVAWT